MVKKESALSIPFKKNILSKHRSKCASDHYYYITFSYTNEKWKIQIWRKIK